MLLLLPFSIFDMSPLSEWKEQGAMRPSLQAANYSSELPNTPVQSRAAVKAKQFVQHE